MNPVTWIFTNWRLILAGLGLLLILSLYGWGSLMKAQRDEKTAVIESMKREAEQYDERSQKIARQINEHSQALVEQAKKDAYKNYLAKYGRNAACGLRLPADHGQTDSTLNSDGTESAGLPLTQDFLDRASKAAVMIDACQKFVTENELEVK